MAKVVLSLALTYLFVIYSQTAEVANIRNHILFRNIRTISTSKSNWKIALVLDLDAFPNFLNQLQSEVQKIAGFTQKTLEHFEADTVSDVSKLLQTLKNVKSYLESFNQTQLELNTEYAQLTKFVNYRRKRSLLPLGSIFKFLFGTASNKDVSGLKRNVAQLANSQKQIVHILEHNLSILNTTRIEISQNRDTINSMLKTLNVLKLAIVRQGNRAERLFVHLASFQEFIGEIETMTAQVRHLFAQAKMFLIDFKVKLNMLSIQRLAPSLISPTHFAEILNELKDNIPSSFTLTDNPDRDIWKFYTGLKCDTVISPNHLAIVIRVPLKPVANSYNLIEADPLDIPYINTTYSINKEGHHVTASVDIESKYFIINEKRSHYALISNEMATSCIRQKLPFCNINKGLSSTFQSGMCVIDSYLNNARKDPDTCQTFVRSKNILPIAKAISSDKYLIITNDEINFSIKCLNGTLSMVKLSDVISTLTLPNQCQAYSNKLFLPLYYEHSASDIQTDNFMLPHSDIYNISTSKLWEPFHAKLSNISLIQFPPSLKQMKQIPIDILADQIHALAASKFDFKQQSMFQSPLFIGICITTIIITILLTFIVLYRRGYIKSCARNKASVQKPFYHKKSLVQFTTSGQEDDNLLVSQPTAPILRLYPSINKRTDNDADIQGTTAVA